MSMKRSLNNKMDDDDEEMNSSNSSLLKDNRKEGDESGQSAIPFCGCLSVQYYQPYFDLDTQEIINRIWSSFFFCRRQETFLETITRKPDAYGPFWITTSLIFIVAVASNISSWLLTYMSGQHNWIYNFQNIVTLVSIIYGFATIGPVLIWLLFKNLETPMNLVPLLCLYGYSLFIYIPVSGICLIPNSILHWLVLLSATVSSTTFLLRNLVPLLVSSNTRQHATILLTLIALLQLGLSISLKILYF